MWTVICDNFFAQFVGHRDSEIMTSGVFDTFVVSIEPTWVKNSQHIFDSGESRWKFEYRNPTPQGKFLTRSAMDPAG